MNPKRKIGVFGGSFDPIHNGHLIAAQSIAQQLKLDQLILMPAYQQPLKNSHSVSAADRLKMVRFAVAGNPLFTVSDYEVCKGGKSYTIDTLKYLHIQFPEATFYLIIGADSLQHIQHWHHSTELPALCQIVVAARLVNVQHIYPAGFTHLILDTPVIEISSTAIREMVARKSDINYLVPAPVKDYILTNNLYSRKD